MKSLLTTISITLLALNCYSAEISLTAGSEITLTADETATITCEGHKSSLARICEFRKNGRYYIISIDGETLYSNTNEDNAISKLNYYQENTLFFTWKR